MKKPTMDNLKAIVANQAQPNASSSATSRPTDNSSQAADWVWQQGAEIYGEQWVRENGETPSTMWKLALNKLSQAQVKNGVAEILKQTIVWPPNLTKYMQLCEAQIDTVDAFNRMINKKPAANLAERQTRHEVGYKCKSQLEESKARKLFSDTLIRNIEKAKIGELVERVIKQQIVSPTEFKKTETVEQKNARLDYQIDEHLSRFSSESLRGALKKRYNER